jgi:NAD(P)-dependent dehydrogenase (short-subunit alcohol dehydrogenase family)
MALASTGVHVIATARTIGALEELDDEISAADGEATLVQMDLRDRPALTNLATAIKERWGRLDIMIANAGVLGVLTPASHLDEDIWDEVIDINLSAIWRMIKVFDGLLQISPQGRAVVVTSSVASGSDYPFWSAYSASKAGAEALTRSWAAELGSTNLKVNLLDPGGVGTSMYGSAFPGANLDEMPKPEDIAPAFVKLTSEDCPYHGDIVHASALI